MSIINISRVGSLMMDDDNIQKNTQVIQMENIFEKAAGETTLFDDAFQQAIAAAAKYSQQQATIYQMVEDPNINSDPAKLIELQKMASDYNIDVSLISALTRKVTSTMETLLRS